MNLGKPACLIVLAGGLLVVASRAEAQTAKALYERGLRSYNIAEYDKAIDDFKKSYELSSRPELLFNIAQAYRLKGDCTTAMRFYKNYQREEQSAAKDRSEVGRAIELCTKPPEPVPPPIPAPPPPVPTAPAAPPPPSAALVAPPPPTTTAQAGVALDRPPEPPVASGRGKRLLGVGLAVGGAALLTGGVWFGLQARAKSNEVAQLFEAGGTWNEHYQQIESDGRRAGTWSKVFYAVGGAALLGGGLLYYLGLAEDRTVAAHFAPMPVPGGLALVWSCVR